MSERYNQIALNKIPEDWSIRTLGELFSFKNGLNKEKRFFGKGTPIINYMDVYSRRELLSSEITGKVSLSKQEIRNYDARKGDVFFTRTSETVEEIGISAVLLDEIEDAVFSGFVLRARPKTDILYDLYKKYCFSTKKVRREITSTSTYTTRALTNGRSLSIVKITVPPKQEQIAISNCLTDIDNLLSSLKKLIAKKENIRKGTMQFLLTGKRRLVGYTDKWQKRKLGEVAKIEKGQLITEKTCIPGNIPVIAGGKTAAYYHDKPNRNNKTITISASGASAGYVSFHTKPIFASDCTTISEGKGYSIEFIYFSLQLLQQKIYKAQTGGAQPHIHASDLNPIEISFPKKDEQEEIAQILLEMDSDITALEKKL